MVERVIAKNVHPSNEDIARAGGRNFSLSMIPTNLIFRTQVYLNELLILPPHLSSHMSKSKVNLLMKIHNFNIGHNFSLGTQVYQLHRSISYDFRHGWGS